MRRMLSAVAVLMLGTAVGTTLNAQACLGLNSPSNVQLLAEAGNSAKTFGAAVTLGGGSVFGGVGAHYTSFDHDLGNAKGVTGHIGTQLGLGAAKKAQLCPIAQAGFSSGPNDVGAGGVDVSDILLAGGLSVGIPVAAGSDFTLIPTGAISLIYDRVKVKTGGISDAESDGYGLLSAGVGFLISPRFVLKPFVDIFLGLEGSDPIFGIVASIGVGKGS